MLRDSRAMGGRSHVNPIGFSSEDRQVLEDSGHVVEVGQKGLCLVSPDTRFQDTGALVLG